MKKRGCTLKVTIKPQLEIDYNDTPQAIMQQIMEAIEQSERFYTPKRLNQTS